MRTVSLNLLVVTTSLVGMCAHVAAEDALPAEEASAPAIDRELNHRTDESRPRVHEGQGRNWMQGRWNRDGMRDRGSWDNRRGQSGTRNFSNRPNPRGTGNRQFRTEHAPIDTGYVFVDGKYLPGPYRLHWEQQQLFLNDQQLPLHSTDDEDHPGRRFHSAWSQSRELQQALQSNSVVLIKTDAQGAPPYTMLTRFDEQLAFLKHVTGGNEDSDETVSVELLAAHRWLEDFRANDDLRARAEVDIAELERTLSAIRGHADEENFAGSWAYPLTAMGMFFVAVAIGQLFISRTLLVKSNTPPSDELQSATRRCLMFIVGLSVLDLTCTLLAMRANVMHELNPLASHLFGDPMAMIAFKLSVTLLGAAVLYVLRAHHSARQAAWWLCLVCTLVTVRWVAFNSLFVA